MKYFGKTAAVLMISFFMFVIENVDGHPQLDIKKIGNSGLDSISKWIDDTLVLSGRTGGMSSGSDNLIFACSRLTGNFDINCVFTNNGIENNEAGLMIREDTTAGSRCIQFINHKTRGLLIRYRLSSDAVYTTIQVKGNNSAALRIKRTDNLFTFFWKMRTESQWRTVSTAYTLYLDKSPLCGLCQSSFSESLVSNAKFCNISGMPENQETCQPVSWEFNTSDIDSTGLDQYIYWNLTSNYMKSTTSGGSKKAVLSTEPLLAFRTDSILTIDWQVYSDRDTSADLDSYTLFGKDSVILKDRMNASGGNIGSGGKLEIGINSTTHNLFAGGNVYLKDRANIKGDVTCKGKVTYGSLVTVTGTVKTGTSVPVPVIPSRTVTIGSTIKTVNPGDSISLAPGKYKSLTVYANAKVRFSSGIYQFSRLEINPDVKFYFTVSIDSTIELNVKDDLKYADRFKMILSDSTLWRNVSIYTNQSNSLLLQTDMKLTGYLYAPFAKITIYSRTLSINGGIFGKSIISEPDFIFSMNSAGESLSIIETVFKNSNAGEDYRLYQKINRISKNDLKDFILFRGNDTIACGSSKKLTPCRTWMTTTCEFYKTTDLNGTGRIRVLFNDGSGNVKVIDTVDSYVKTFSDLTMNYSTGKNLRCRPVGIDNISVSCNTSCTPVIEEKNLSDTTVLIGEDVRLSYVITSGTECSYQWYKNGSAINDENTFLLILKNVMKTDSGSTYYCKVVNMCDTAISDTMTLSVDSCVEPVITTQPQSDTLEPGMDARFDVQADGLDLTYQWKKNSEDLTGMTDDTMTLNNVSMLNNMDEITVRVKSRCGKEVLSNTATIHMIEVSQCTITVSLQSDTLETGDYYYGEVKATCDNLYYEWYKNGSFLKQTPNNHLVYGPVTSLDSGSSFTCVITNGARSDTSSPAFLTVVPQRKGNRLVTISGRLLNGLNKIVGENGPELHEFMVKLFTGKNGGKEIYSELFIKDKRIAVDSGVFTIHLGRGETSQDIQSVFASYANVYAEVYTGDSSHFELTGPRMVISSAPYSLTSGIKVLHGNGSPVVNSISAPPGTMYIDQGDGNRTWKLLNNGWKKLD